MNIIHQYSDFWEEVFVMKFTSLSFYPQQRQVNISTFKKKGNK